MKFTNVPFLLLLELLLFSCTHAKAPYMYEGYGDFSLRANFSSKHYIDYGLDLSIRRTPQNSRWWVTKRFGLASSVIQDSSQYFSFQGTIALTTLLMTEWICHRGPYEASNSPIFTALTLPSSQFEYALSDYYFLGISNNTEYIFIRGGNGNRGIFYTPALTFSIWGYPNNETCDIWAIQLQLGHTFFWNFEGKSRVDGWTIGGSIFLGYH